MTIEVPDAVMHPWPDPMRVVRKPDPLPLEHRRQASALVMMLHEHVPGWSDTVAHAKGCCLVWNFDFHYITVPDEVFFDLLGSGVVVAFDLVNVALQPVPVVLGIPPREVAEVEDVVSRLHHAIPVLNELLIHLFERSKGTSRMLEDAFVSKMGVGGKPVLLHRKPGIMPVTRPYI